MASPFLLCVPVLLIASKPLRRPLLALRERGGAEPVRSFEAASNELTVKAISKLRDRARRRLSTGDAASLEYASSAYNWLQLASSLKAGKWMNVQSRSVKPNVCLPSVRLFCYLYSYPLKSLATACYMLFRY